MQINKEAEILLEQMDKKENGPWMFVRGVSIRHSKKVGRNGMHLCPIAALGLCKNNSDALKINRIFAYAMDNVPFESPVFSSPWYNFYEAQEIRRRAVNIIEKQINANT